MHVNTSSLAGWQVMMMVVQCSDVEIHERQSYGQVWAASKYILVKKILHCASGEPGELASADKCGAEPAESRRVLYIWRSNKNRT